MNNHANNQPRRLALAIALVLAATMLAGCGGGGMVRADAPVPAPPPPTPPPPPPPPVTGDLVINVPADTGRGEPNGLPTAQNLIKEGEGWLWLSGSSTFTQSVQINAGMVSLLLVSTAPAILDSDVYINPAGRLDHDGIITGSVFNRGKMVVWNPYNDGVEASYGHPRIGGNYIQDGSATLVVMLDSDLRIAGDVTLNGGTLEIGLGYANPVYSLTPQILHADGTITGQFGNVVLPSVFLSGTVNYGAHDITLALTPVSAKSVINNAGVGDAATQVGASNLDAVMAQAGALEAAAPESLGNAQRQFIASVAAIRRAGDLSQAVSSLDSLSGQAYASTRDLLLESSERQSLLEHLGQVRHGNASGAWTSARSNGTSFADTGTMQANVVRSGTQGGIDQNIGDDLIVGLAAGNGEVRVDYERGGDQARMQLPSATAYVHFTRDRWHATALLDQTRATLSMQRWIDLGDAGGHRADSELKLDKFGAYFEGGREFRIGRSMITPFVGMAYDALRSDAFVEHGDTGLELIGQAAHTERTTTDLGLRYRRDWRWGGDGWARLSLDGTYRHALHAGNDVLRAAYVGAPQVEFGLPGLATDRDARWLNLGLDLGRGDRWSGFVRYDRSVVGDDSNQAWWLGAMWKF